MPEKPLKILLVGDASSYNATLAKGLRDAGHDVTVASHGGRWLDTDRDLFTGRRFPGRAGGLDLWLRLQFGLMDRMKGFDVVSIASQSFIELKPHRIKVIYDRLRSANRSIFYNALGTDSHYVDFCTRADCPFPYSEYGIHGSPTPYTLAYPDKIRSWLSPQLSELHRHILSTADGATTALYEYDMALRDLLPDDKRGYAGIPVDTASLRPVELPDRIDKVRLFLGRYKGRLEEKGTDIFEQAARAVIGRHPGKAELIIVENRPYKEYLELLRSGHVVLDQIYSLTPATNALQAMALGLNSMSGAAEEFYRFIGEPTLRPVIDVGPDYESVERAIEHVVTHPDEIRPRGLAGREFVIRHNDVRVVADRCLDFWTKTLAEKEEK